MEIRLIHLLALFLCAVLGYSQGLELDGTVLDDKNSPIAYANVILLSQKDSTLVSGVTSNEKGIFHFQDLRPGNYILTTSFMGFKSYSLTLELENKMEIPPIILKENEQRLNEINLVGTKPTLKKEVDRLVFRVENTALTEGSIWDVLRGTPGILMINDQITVKNSANIIYLINGKRVYLTGNELQQLFSSSNAAYVQSIEVITNPPAKYDAEGGAVINIKMSKNLITGYNGSLFANYTQGTYPRPSVGTSHFYRRKNTGIYLSYTYDAEKLNRIDRSNIVFTENESPIGSWKSDVDRNTSSKSHNANLNVEHAFNDKNELNFSANTNYTPYWKRSTQTATQAIDSSFNSLNNTNDNKLNLALNLDYSHQSNKGNKLSSNLHFTNYDYDRLQNVTTDYIDANGIFIRNNSFKAISDQKTNIYSGNLDYSIPMKNEATFETGAKVAFVETENDIEQALTNNGLTLYDNLNSGVFDYKETTLAAYVSYSKTWGSWSLNSGLRAENTSIDSKTSGAFNDNTQDYFKVFPTVIFSYNFNNNHNFSLSYNKRITRPSYTNLNPFKFYLSDNAFVQGNPDLNPTLSHLTTLSYTLKDTYTFELYCRFEKNPISEIPLQDNNNNKIKYVATNLKEAHDYGFDFITYKPLTNAWSIYLVNSIFYDTAEFFALENNTPLQSNQRWSMYTNAVNYFSFLEDKSLNAELSILYISPVIDGPSRVSSRTQVDITIKKSFLEGKWIASMAMNDIFRTTDFTVTNNYLNQDNKTYSCFDNQWFRFGVRYNFGNTDLKANTTTTSHNERERLESNDH
ncbi:outer membrane beta-barrel family protein [Mangrovimonas aestuarii]|uniref:outer membrane beta-barrel family protein n=1 Tax=Mangrovimonas aestuarii TaxID=3018443 RepID=UPI0023784565|nr:outer membrane beta-barrel family protein [Mangrovimonas aestuarii]